MPQYQGLDMSRDTAPEHQFSPKILLSLALVLYKSSGKPEPQFQGENSEKPEDSAEKPRK